MAGFYLKMCFASSLYLALNSYLMPNSGLDQGLNQTESLTILKRVKAEAESL